MIGYIYKTTDKTNGKIYVGQHRSSIFESYDYIGSGIIVTSIKQYCLNNNIPIENRFLIEMIDSADSVDELNEKEVYWIDTLCSRNPDIGYNLRKGGECGPGGPRFQGHHHTEETIQRMKQNRSGSKNANFGNRWSQSDELKQLHSVLSSGENNGMYGKKHSDEAKQKMRLSSLGKICVSNKESDTVKKILPDELESYLLSGWIKGNIHCKGKVQRLSNES